jgi:hypothetical protein
MFVLHPDPYLLPSYNIAPFQTKDIYINSQLPVSNSIDAYFTQRFFNRHFGYVNNGRQAINIALQHYQLQPTDEVCILTTSNNFYISSCVTKEIEKFCTWSRIISNKTKVIFVNHEFGYPFQNMEALLQYNLPIIEDCCHSFFSKDGTNEIGTIGDFAIYSFPKMFPIQIGGLLTSKHSIQPTYIDNQDELQYIKNVLSHYINDEQAIILTRIANYQYLSNNINKDLFAERFDLQNGIVPGVFMFTCKTSTIDLTILKQHFYAHGIQCSVFYGENSFFIPVHQALTENDAAYFLTVLSAAPIHS